jgi:hypothetical protein
MATDSNADGATLEWAPLKLDELAPLHMILLSLLLMPSHLFGSHQELRSKDLPILPLLIIGMRLPPERGARF